MLVYLEMPRPSTVLELPSSALDWSSTQGSDDMEIRDTTLSAGPSTFLSIPNSWAGWSAGGAIDKIGISKAT